MLFVMITCLLMAVVFGFIPAFTDNHYFYLFCGVCLVLAIIAGLLL